MKGEHRHHCAYCRMDFLMDVDRYEHMARVHQLKFDHKCSVCNKEFLNESERESHENKCNRRHVCGICHKHFINKTNLERYKPVHTGEKRFSYLQCGRRFTDKYNMERHKRNIHNASDTK